MVLHLSHPVPALSTSIPSIRLNGVAAWFRLPLRIQEEIGALAVALAVAGVGKDVAADIGGDAAAWPYQVACVELGARLGYLVHEALSLSDTDPRPVPDLRPFGIRQCGSCGCTDNYGSFEGARSWAGEELCSACAPPAAPG